MESGACSWQRSEESLDSVDLSFIVENANGLGALYADKQSNEYFEPTEIADYPAVYASLVDNRDSGFCDLWVGVNERDVMHFMAVLASEETAEASCGLATDVAEATISTPGVDPNTSPLSWGEVRMPLFLVPVPVGTGTVSPTPTGSTNRPGDNGSPVRSSPPRDPKEFSSSTTCHDVAVSRPTTGTMRPSATSDVSGDDSA
ncbi:DUF3558 family protein [Saccharomonospora glauca]|uniref:DUF3558 family protein n=1 Tax=Saccharomonospora glauca TaxID=40990 RepID=UPI00024A465E|nr:DUF3558 family protein [Saccharomonospora glauca]